MDIEAFHEGVKRHKHRIIKAIILLLLIALGLFGALFLYFYVGDDLVLDLEANQTSFRVRNTEDARVNVTMRTRGQLFCETDCRLALLDANSRSVDVEEVMLTQGGTFSKEFTLEPGRTGTGQSLYSAVATCRNREAPLCPTLAPEWRKTILLTVNYGLDAREEEVKPALKAQLEGMLAELRDTDAVLQAIDALISTNPSLRTGHLVPSLTVMQERFAEANIFLENAKVLWAEQSYLPLADIVASSGTSQASLETLHQEADAMEAEILALPQEHNALMARITAIRETLGLVLAAHPRLLEDLQVVYSIENATAGVNGLVRSYGEGLYADYVSLEGNISAVELAVDGLNVTLAGRESQVIALGNNLLTAELQAQCNCTNVTSNATSIAAVCGGINDTQYLQQFCVERNMTGMPINMTPLLPVVLQQVEVNSSINVTLPEHVPLCCVFGECKPCCSACSDEPYPVLFVHGHSFNSFNSPEYSLGGYFSKIQQRLQDEGYVDAGILTPTSTLGEVEPGEWGMSGRPVTVRVTYYYNFYREDDDYVVITQKSESIETYAIRLNEIIKATQHHTGKKKVRIVAHSMGGLVVRRYIQLFGEESIDKVILIGTPNNGIAARTKTLCPVFGESKECDDMTAGSVFMRKVNDPSNRPGIDFVTITGHGCPVGDEDGDGVVQASSVALPGVRNYDVNGSCADFFGSDFHTEILNIEKYPEVYGIIKDELK